MGVPGAHDSATIAAPATDEYSAHGAKSVCSLSISADAGNGGAATVDAGSGITVSGDFSASGSGARFSGNITVEGTTTISGGNATDGAVFYSGDVAYPQTTTLETQNLTIADGADFGLDGGSTIVKVIGSATIGSSSIWSNGNDPTIDAVAKLELDGSTALTGDVNAQLDVNLPPTAHVDLAGHLLNVHGDSNSRWSAGADLESSTSGGVAQFSDDCCVALLVDGKITIGAGTTLRITGPTTGAVLSDGTALASSGGPTGSAGEIGGAGALDWVRGSVQGSITLDTGFHTNLDGGGIREIGDQERAGTLINHGQLSVAGGTLNTVDFSGRLFSDGTLNLSSAATLNGSATITGGRLVGSGTITGNLHVAGGTVVPEADPSHPGTLKVGGDFVQGSRATLQIPVVSASSYSILRVAGNVKLGGGLTLAPSLRYQAAAASNDTLGVLRYGGKRTGAFGRSTASPRFTRGHWVHVVYPKRHLIDAVISGPPPNTRITKTRIKRAGRVASFKFAATGGTRPDHFQCRLTGQSKRLNRWQKCRSLMTYTHLRTGNHVFEVRAVDANENRDRSPAKKKFRIQPGKRS